MHIPNSLAHILVHSIQVSKLSSCPSTPQIWMSYPWSSAVECFPTAKLTPPNLLSWRKTYIPMNHLFGLYVLRASSLPLPIHFKSSFSHWPSCLLTTESTWTSVRCSVKQSLTLQVHDSVPSATGHSSIAIIFRIYSSVDYCEVLWLNYLNTSNIDKRHRENIYSNINKKVKSRISSLI